MSEHRDQLLLFVGVVKLAILVLIVALLVGKVAARPLEPSIPQSAGWFLNDSTVLGDMIDMVSADDGWILRFGGPEKAGHLYRWDGDKWTPAGSLAHSQDVHSGDIAMLSATDGWIVLGGGTFNSLIPNESAFYHYDGTKWEKYSTVTGPEGVHLRALDMLTPDYGWAVGYSHNGGVYYHWDGNSWKSVMEVAWEDSATWDIDMVSPTDGWAVGDIFAHWDGTTWSDMSPPGVIAAQAIDMLSATDGWAVGLDNGAAGPIWRWNGTEWIDFASPVTEEGLFLRSIDMITTDDGWAVGSAGEILHWDGVSWRQAFSPTHDSLRDIDMLSSVSGWIPSTGRGIYQYLIRELTLNVADGAPGSFFTVIGVGFPANEDASVEVNGRNLGTITTAPDGAFTLVLSTAEASEGIYVVLARVGLANPRVATQFRLDANAPVRPQDGTGPIIDVPAGIALTDQLFLPVSVR